MVDYELWRHYCDLYTRCNVLFLTANTVEEFDELHRLYDERDAAKAELDRRQFIEAANYVS